MDEFYRIAKTFDKDQIKAAYDFLNERWKYLTRQETLDAAEKYRPGDLVSFKSKKRGGREVVGRIKKINIKTISLEKCRYIDGSYSGESWKVPPSYISPFSGKLPEKSSQKG